MYANIQPHAPSGVQANGATFFLANVTPDGVRRLIVRGRHAGFAGERRGDDLLCPLTAQPDFATIKITYVPGPRLVELKSLKLYLWSYRNEGAFHEDVTNRILNDFVAAAQPRRLSVVSEFLPRGGITTVVRVHYTAP